MVHTAFCCYCCLFILRCLQAMGEHFATPERTGRTTWLLTALASAVANCSGGGSLDPFGKVRRWGLARGSKSVGESICFLINKEWATLACLLVRADSLSPQQQQSREHGRGRGSSKFFWPVTVMKINHTPAFKSDTVPNWQYLEIVKTSVHNCLTGC